MTNSSNFKAAMFLKHFDLCIQYSWCSVYCWLFHPHYAIFFLFKWLTETSDLEQRVIDASQLLFILDK